MIQLLALLALLLVVLVRGLVLGAGADAVDETRERSDLRGKEKGEENACWMMLMVLCTHGVG